MPLPAQVAPVQKACGGSGGPGCPCRPRRRRCRRPAVAEAARGDVNAGIRAVGSHPTPNPTLSQRRTHPFGQGRNARRFLDSNRCFMLFEEIVEKPAEEPAHPGRDHHRRRPDHRILHRPRKHRRHPLPRPPSPPRPPPRHRTSPRQSRLRPAMYRRTRTARRPTARPRRRTTLRRRAMLPRRATRQRGRTLRRAADAPHPRSPSRLNRFPAPPATTPSSPSRSAVTGPARPASRDSRA